jgi:hypothetical protein
MPLTTPQLATLRAAILANTDPEFVTYREGGNAVQMAVYLNAPASPVEIAWNHDATRRQLDEQANYATFDGLSAGKRDAWTLFLDGFPRDMRKNKNRGAVTDVWGSATSGASLDIITAATRNITRAEKILGGAATKTTGRVTALDLVWTGPLSPADVVDALQ